MNILFYSRKRTIVSNVTINSYDVTKTHLAWQLTLLSLTESSNISLLKKPKKYFVMLKGIASVLTVVLLQQIFVVVTSPFQLNILHTNDIHARVDMFSRRSQSCKVEEMKPDDKKTKCYGGVVRRGGFIEEFRKKHKNVLLLDAGDQYQGTLWFHVFRGHIARFFLEHHRYDAMVCFTITMWHKTLLIGDNQILLR